MSPSVSILVKMSGTETEKSILFIPFSDKVSRTKQTNVVLSDQNLILTGLATIIFTL